MDILCEHHPHMAGHFKPDWRKGELFWQGEMIVAWQINVEDAKVNMQAKREYADLIAEGMTAGLSLLNFGYEDPAAPPRKGKDKGKGSSKGKKKSRYDLPILQEAFKREPEIYRNQLGNLQLAKYPFTVSIKTLRDTGTGAAASAHKRAGDVVGSVSKLKDANTRQAALHWRAWSHSRPVGQSEQCTALSGVWSARATSSRTSGSSSSFGFSNHTSGGYKWRIGISDLGSQPEGAGAYLLG